MKNLYLLLFLLGVLSCSKQNQNAQQGFDKRIDSLIQLMTLEEKIGQMNLLTSDWDVTGPTMRAHYKEDIKYFHKKLLVSDKV